jgi:membrane protein
MSDAVQRMFEFNALSPMKHRLLAFMPTIISWIIFTAAYYLVPNTKVKFKGALFSGVLCGTLFQVVQWLFVTGQVYVSKYNAIYGSFAFLPLLLIWLQLSWLIALAGVVLTYAWQNFDSFAYRDKAKEMSQSYTNNLAIAVLTQAVKRFKSQNGLLTRSDIIRNYDIPGTLADRLLSNLQQAGLLNRVSQGNGDKEEYAFQPAFDPDDFTLNDTLKRLARIGKSDFIPKADTSFTKVWSAIKAIQNIQQQANDIALLDLPDADNAQTDICDETK